MSAAIPEAGRFTWEPTGGPTGDLRADPDTAADPSASLLVADSWLVEGGRVRAVELHLRRFANACRQRFGLTTAQAVAFLSAVLQRLPTEGRWFPRLEARADSNGTRLALWVRPAPPRGGPVLLWHPGLPDPRTSPGIKGPDLEILGRLRESARMAGGDEPVLLSPSGLVREGATTSLVWWRGRTLCLPPPGPGVLPGVTRALLTTAAQDAGHPVVHEAATPADLAGVPVWAVNALHGIRPVVGWLDFPDELPAPLESSADAEYWQENLAQYALRPHLGLVPGAVDPEPGTRLGPRAAEPFYS